MASAAKVPEMMRLGFVVFLFLLSAGCAINGAGSSTEDSDPRRSTTKTPETTEPSMKQGELSIKQIAANSPGQGAKGPRVSVAPSAAALSSALGPEAKIPDSGEGAYIAAFWGERPTGGFSMAVRSARSQAGKVTVELTLKRPPKDAFVAQALTYPYVVAVVRGVTPDAKFVFVGGDGRELGWPVERVGG